MSSADDQYEQQNDVTGGDVPAGDSMDNDYKSRTGQHTHMPVQADDKPVEDPIDPATADSDETLGMFLLRCVFMGTFAFSFLLFLTFIQLRMIPMPLTRATSLVAVPEVQSPMVDTRSQVTKRVYLDQRMERRHSEQVRYRHQYFVCDICWAQGFWALYISGEVE